VPGTPQDSSSLLCVPLLSREKVVGVITLTRTSGRSRWTLTRSVRGPFGADPVHPQIDENARFDDLIAWSYAST